MDRHVNPLLHLLVRHAAEPALESAHALGALEKMRFKPTDVVVLTVSGRGDKDIETYLSDEL